MSFLELKDIGKIYVNAGNVTVGIRGVNLNFEKGEFVAVTGKSGSGKSTFLNVISGMDTYEEGELLIENEPTSHFLQPDWEKYRSEYISFIFQDYNIIESFTVLQNVELALMHIEDKKERRKRALELIDRVGMTSHIKHKGSKLSGGQKQRTVIARALAKDSPIILADEPTGNLDSATSAEIIKLLGEVSKDKLLIVVTHNYDEVADHATRHIRFFDGAVESDTVLRLPTLTATENKKAEKKNKIVNEKKKDVKDGFTLGNAIFTSRPKLSFFLCLLLLIGSLGIFASTASFGDVSSLFQREKMFTDIEGRVVVTKRNGEIITEDELQQIATEYGAKNVLHYDLLLDMGDDNYFKFLDEEDGYYEDGYYNRGVFLSCTYNENFGDDIIGYITKGYGITVHSTMCPNIEDLEDRFIDVRWNETITKKYPTSLLIRTLNNDNVLMEIIAKTSNSNITVESVKTINSNENNLYEITLLVESKEKLNKYINDLMMLSNILSVERLLK